MKSLEYIVVGRFMNGREVTHYRLKRADGVYENVTKQKAIFLIGRGMIANMRLQSLPNNDVMIRGKGVNLNELPEYSVKDLEERKGNLKVKRRVMKGTSCIGYELENSRGEKKILSRAKVTKLALDKEVENLEAFKTKDSLTGEIRVALRGVGCKLTELEVIVVDNEGKVVPKEKVINNVRFRVLLVKTSGILCDTEKGKMEKFQSGDFLVCNDRGDIKPVDRGTVQAMFNIDKESNVASCDPYLNNGERYRIESVSGSRYPITKDKIMKWTIVKKK